MPEAKAPASAARFASDLREIRSERGVSLDDLHEQTKIPRELLEKFEADGLQGHPMFNRVYLRSLARSYAEAVDLPPERVADALEAALNGSYDSSLLRPPPEPEPEPEPAEPEPPEADPEHAEHTDATTPSWQALADDPAAPVGADAEPEAPPPPAWAATSPPGAAPPAEPPPQRERPARREAAPPRQRTREPERRAPWLPILLGVLVVAALAGVGWWLLSGDGDPAEDPTAVVEGTQPEADDEDAEAEPEPDRPAPEIGDEIDVVVVARDANVAPMRITRDDDVRRPYWIEQGQAKAFPAQQRAVLEEELDIVRVLVEGYEYPTSQRDGQGRIVLDRPAVEAFLDTVRTEPVSLGAEPQRVPVGPIASQ